MNPRISSIENLVASDPAGRNIFGLVLSDQLRLSAQSLRLAKRVGIVSGFFVTEAGAGETDGPPGAKVVGWALEQIGIKVDYLTDERNASLFRAIGVEPLVGVDDYLDRMGPTHLVSIERVGRGADGRYRNLRGVDISDVTDPLDELFVEASRRGLTTIGIGDGGNEIGMGKVFALPEGADSVSEGLPHELEPTARCVVATDFCIVAGVSNWGAYGLAGALSVLEGRDLLPLARDVLRDLEAIVKGGGAVDGVTHRSEPTCDGIGAPVSLQMLENIRRQLASSPLGGDPGVSVGILGYGESGQAAAKLLTDHGYRVLISDAHLVTLSRGTAVAGVEAGGHTIDFLADCALVVASPGVRGDAPILAELHRRGIPVISELELAFQLGVDGTRAPRLIAVTGTIGKRTTVELLQRLFGAAGRSIAIGGNRGTPLSSLVGQSEKPETIALAVSSFQLETVVHFRPNIAIMLNIDEAHLDRHRSIAEYVRIKSRVFMNQRPEDALILPFDDRRLRPLARKHQGRMFFVSSRQSVDRGAWYVDGKIRVNLDGRSETIENASSPFPVNLLSAVLAARLAGISLEQISRAVGDGAN